MPWASRNWRSGCSSTAAGRRPPGARRRDDPPCRRGVPLPRQHGAIYVVKKACLTLCCRAACAHSGVSQPRQVARATRRNAW
eukprot:10138727-Alexandrium_andersonii.AAC.1